MSYANVFKAAGGHADMAPVASHLKATHNKKTGKNVSVSLDHKKIDTKVPQNFHKDSVDTGTVNKAEKFAQVFKASEGAKKAGASRSSTKAAFPGVKKSVNSTQLSRDLGLL